jgi:hypothetical protein
VAHIRRTGAHFAGGGPSGEAIHPECGSVVSRKRRSRNRDVDESAKGLAEQPPSVPAIDSALQFEDGHPRFTVVQPAQMADFWHGRCSRSWCGGPTRCATRNCSDGSNPGLFLFVSIMSWQLFGRRLSKANSRRLSHAWILTKIYQSKIMLGAIVHSGFRNMS